MFYLFISPTPATMPDKHGFCSINDGEVNHWMSKQVCECALPGGKGRLTYHLHACCIEMSVFRFPLFHVSVRKEWGFHTHLWFLTMKNSIKMVATTARHKEDFCFYLKEDKWALSFSVLLTNQSSKSMQTANHPKNPLYPIWGLHIWCLYAAQCCFCHVPLIFTIYPLPSAPNWRLAPVE